MDTKYSHGMWEGSAHQADTILGTFENQGKNKRAEPLVRNIPSRAKSNKFLSKKVMPRGTPWWNGSMRLIT